MTWLRIDDTMPQNPKIIGLSDAAFRTHITGLAYCAQHLTDGFIPEPVAKPMRAKRELVTAKLWRRPDGARTATGRRADGWIINDYLEYNPSKDEVVANRENRRKRAEAGGRAKAAKAASSSAKSLLQAGDVSVHPALPVPDIPLTPTSGGIGLRSEGTNPRAIAEAEERDEKRGRAVAACRKLYNEATRDGDSATVIREWLEREYRHDPSIVLDAVPQWRASA